MEDHLTNQLRGYGVIVSALEALSEDICRECIGLSGAQTKLLKGLKKAKMDLVTSNDSEEAKRTLQADIDRCLTRAESIDVAEDCECQKTTDRCTIGTECFALAALKLMEQVC